ncbi:hypothetical protein ABB55_10640 [Prosthecomicrobium hirschii]|uniref:Tetrapyrrole methylase domain-containing protein n=1 Tax=Prosthecodimorpha hirschii TaxID=665126 RepID=A0A0P6WD31_9HYPH|nr:precorrin-6y C5,15-methyltransferase (decarboxylating) subunit CbiE [Prosthecomicrobium hirschii]KPL52623.1 hypothetical protein ABB55_10640 [Prosthecomicrobium hirschii]
MSEAVPARWLTLIGLGEDGLDGLAPTARRVLADAELVVGGARHLRLAGLDSDRPSDSGPQRLVWPSPLVGAIPDILGWRGRRVVVLASGDPFHYGVGATLAAHVPADEMLCLPAPSAFALAAARLGWGQQDCTLLSLHGRSFERIVPTLQPGARILALSWDGTTPGRIAATLAARGLGDTRMTVLECLGGPRERIRTTTAAGFELDGIDPLNTVALEVVAGRDAWILPRAAGLPDEAFESDGQITKREIRAITLSALAPRRGELLWDVGAGSGSVGIEWMLADPNLATIAIEPRRDRAARIARNAAALGVPGLQIVDGAAPAALAGLPTPDAIFVGGGATAEGVIEACLAALKPGGRLVVNGVTLEAQARLGDERRRRGGDLIMLQVARAEPLGGFLGWRPAMPVVQWRMEKP